MSISSSIEIDHDQGKVYQDKPFKQPEEAIRRLSFDRTSIWSMVQEIPPKDIWFGKLGDWQGALDRLNREWPYIVNGQVPPTNGDDRITLKTLCSSFLNSKQSKLKSDELSPASFDDYFRTCELVVNQFGIDRNIEDLRPDDFERFRESLATRLGVVTLTNEINRCRILFKYAYDQRFIDQLTR